ncbi:MAG: serine--tRNA ligase [bacterium]
MLDTKLIRENPDKIKKACKDKQVKVDIDRILELDEKRRELLQEMETLKAEQNKISQKGASNEEQRNKAKEIKEKIRGVEPEFDKVKDEFDELMHKVPNPSLDDVPVGKDENDNKVLRIEGKRPKFDYEPKDYLEIAEKLEIIDVKRAAKVSGTRFGYLKGEAVLLEFALVQMALDVLIKDGFMPVIPPVMLNHKAMSGMGYLDRGVDEVYYLEKDKLYLTGTSEQSIGVMHMGEILDKKELPKRYVGFSTCFRREAGAYGKDTKGILRVHQFDKMEMFSFCDSKKSQDEHEFFLSLQEKLMKLLEISYQVVNICTGDLGDPAARKWDIETFLPSEKKYRETHSTSNCTDYQARRLNIRYREKGNDKLEFVHTINGTAFAMGRMLISIIENYQQKDGSIKVPEALQKYMNGLKKIG